ncbi:MAG: AAA family ATPase [Candidatus Pelagibacter bacterium]|nr:AAA family ATPase [Candidatus Pelagibacter bacterium]
MNLEPSENTSIYGYRYFFSEITELYNNRKMPNKILLSGKKGSGKATFAYHLVNFFLSKNEEFKYNLTENKINPENKSFKLLQSTSHPNFYLIDLLAEKKNIDVAQIRGMISYTNKSTFNNQDRFIMIDNVEYLNKNSINALLKIIEEPNENIYFILIANSEKNILPTLKSRCITFKIHFSFDETVNICNQILNQNILNELNYDLINYYFTPGEIIKLIRFAEEKQINLREHDVSSIISLIIENTYYKKSIFIKNLLINFIELFLLKRYKTSNNKNYLLNFYQSFIQKINNTEKFNLDEESLFLEFKSKIL